ncbi:hypothetical protein [uncultured Draconibacterium sp.]|uniref:hypothetical protein n=1 Tax=uncultured Draconibacterium sp. TaxID=1573823 RepID=UPI0025E3EC9F|nr:hypothetical protein [uncultured Draconibacterium sp.]
MKAKEENGQVKFYKKLPSRYRSETLNIAGGFNKLPKEIHEAEGFFDVVKPEIVDPAVETLGKPYIDHEKKICTYSVEAIVLNIDEVRANKRKYFIDKFNRVATVITQAGLAIDPNDPESVTLYDQKVAIARQFKIEAMNYIATENDPSRLVKFRVQEEDVNYVLNLFEPFLI